MVAGDVMEIFGVVADPASGQTIRAYQTGDRAAVPPAELGKRIAGKLKELGAAALLNGSAEIPAGA